MIPCLEMAGSGGGEIPFIFIITISQQMEMAVLYLEEVDFFFQGIILPSAGKW